MNRCWFAARVIDVKRAYGLSVDRRERDALARVLAGCADTEIDMTPRGTTAAAAAPPKRGTAGPADGTDALALYDDNGNGRITCAEARRHGIAPVPRSHPAYRYILSVHAGRGRRRRGMRVERTRVNAGAATLATTAGPEPERNTANPGEMRPRAARTNPRQVPRRRASEAPASEGQACGRRSWKRGQRLSPTACRCAQAQGSRARATSRTAASTCR